MISQDEARARVQRGAAHLDVVRPGWFNDIDTGTLTMDDACGCIVGQLCGNYFSGKSELLIDGKTAFSFGVALPDMEDATEAQLDRMWRPIQDAWVEAIADRRLSTTPNGTPEVVAVSVRPTVEVNGCSRP